MKNPKKFMMLFALCFLGSLSNVAAQNPSLSVRVRITQYYQSEAYRAMSCEVIGKVALKQIERVDMPESGFLKKRLQRISDLYNACDKRASRMLIIIAGYMFQS